MTSHVNTELLFNITETVFASIIGDDVTSDTTAHCIYAHSSWSPVYLSEIRPTGNSGQSELTYQSPCSLTWIIRDAGYSQTFFHCFALLKYVDSQVPGSTYK
jgi:hypothetical protein